MSSEELFKCLSLAGVSGSELFLVLFQGDPLPAALVELVRSSPISSVEDLQLLLLSDSVGKDGSILIFLKCDIMGRITDKQSRDVAAL